MTIHPSFKVHARARFELALAPTPVGSSARLAPQRLDMLMQAIAARMVALRPHLLYEERRDGPVAADHGDAGSTHGGGH
jgi:hypothetical protein